MIKITKNRHTFASNIHRSPYSENITEQHLCWGWSTCGRRQMRRETAGFVKEKQMHRSLKMFFQVWTSTLNCLKNHCLVYTPSKLILLQSPIYRETSNLNILRDILAGKAIAVCSAVFGKTNYVISANSLSFGR